MSTLEFPMDFSPSAFWLVINKGNIAWKICQVHRGFHHTCSFLQHQEHHYTLHSQPTGTAVPTPFPNSTHRVFPQQRLRNSPLPCYPPLITTEGFSPAVAKREQQQLSRRLEEQSQTAAVTTHSANVQYLGRDCIPVLPAEWCPAVVLSAKE